MGLEGTYILNDEDLDQTLLHGMKARIERNGCFINSECNIYSYKLATLFAEHELNLFEQNSGSVKQIIGWELIDIYKAAYEDGLKHFDSLFHSIDMYGEHSELIIDSLHQHCYHTMHDEHGFNRPWMDILCKVPYSLSNKILVTYGFYSGILSKVYYLTNNFKAVFDKYDTGKNCTTCKTEKSEDLNNFKTDVHSTNREHNYCISKIQIANLYDLFTTEKVIEPIDFTAFLKCFDLDSTPNKHPIILYKKMFVFALSLIDGMKSSTALKNFGFTNYDKNKSCLIKSPIPKDKRVTKNKINTILTQPTTVITK